MSQEKYIEFEGKKFSEREIFVAYSLDKDQLLAVLGQNTDDLFRSIGDLMDELEESESETKIKILDRIMDYFDVHNQCFARRKEIEDHFTPLIAQIQKEKE